jgi:mannose-6-phosphate isomerase-like protein (cupin superfamily)
MHILGLMPRIGAVLFCSFLLLLRAGGGAAQPAPPPTPKPPLQGSLTLSWEDIQSRNPGGHRWQLLQAPTATLDELEMHVTEVAAGKASHEPHRHADEEIIVIKQGTFDVFQDGRITRVGPGGLVFHATNSLHNLKNVGEGPGVYHVIRWTSPRPPVAAPAVPR